MVVPNIFVLLLTIDLLIQIVGHNASFVLF